MSTFRENRDRLVEKLCEALDQWEEVVEYEVNPDSASIRVHVASTEYCFDTYTIRVGEPGFLHNSMR